MSMPVQEAPSATDAETRALAKAAQNPIANLISLPLQNNTDFGIGPTDATKNTLNIQPVWPFSVGENVNLITRTILPVVYEEEIVPGTGSESGLGDTTFTGFFSPKDSGELTWGVGPVVLLPTATDDRLGAGEAGLGVSAIALGMPGNWVVGGLISNVWSFEGSVNLMTIQPIINYNLARGWYLVSAPIITANWEADSGDTWAVPLGGGIGKIVRFGNLPVNINLQAYDYVESSTLGPDWQMRFQMQFLFPK